MSNQIVITSGAKVRNLSGVLTATSGVVDSVGLGTANGVATLDSNGKVPLSQLPASVVTYLGTWNAATNTPTLANGTGDIGDLYICNVAGTVNFGAGPITFAVGDWVIYNGSQWQKSAGASGTVTSVAMTVPTGLSVTGSPITTSGTLAVSLSSGYTIPTTSFLSGLVPYTGATQTVDLGSYDLNARGIKVNGTAGSGHVDFKHQTGNPTGSASSTTMFADTNGNMAWKNDHNYITTLASNANTADRTYTFPNASGTIALTSDISYPVTSVFGRTGAVTAQSGDYTTTQVTEGTNLYYTDARARGAISLTTTGTSGAATYNSTTGVLNIPNYSETTFGTVTSVGLSSATSGVTIGSSPITTSGTITLAIATASGSQQGLLSSTDWNTFNGKQGAITLTTTGTSGAATLIGNTLNIPNYAPDLSNYVTLNTSQTITGSKTFNAYILSSAGGGNQATVVANISTLHSGSSGFNGFGFNVNNNIYFGKGLDNGGVFSWNNTTVRYYTLPDATGTIALTSDIPSLSGYVTLASNQTVTGLKTFTNDQTFNGNIIGTTGYFTTNLVVGTSAGSSYKLDVTGNSRFTSDIRLDNGAADGAQLVLASSGFSDWNIDNFSGNFRWYYGATERMRLTAAGNLAIGTTSPITFTNYNTISVNGSTGGAVVTMSNGTSALRMACGTTDSALWEPRNVDFAIGTNNTERMRITSGGQVLINRSSAASSEEILGIQAKVNTTAFDIQIGTDTYYGIRFRNQSGTQAGYIQINSSVVIYGTGSDYRLKKDFKDYNGLDLVSKIKTYDFAWNVDDSRMYGVIAHELHDVIPYAVSGQKDSVNKDGSINPQGVDYSKLVPILVKAIQEQQAQIEELKALINK